jgi:hypothetical protein
VLYSSPAWSPEQSNASPFRLDVPRQVPIHPRFAQGLVSATPGLPKLI